MAEVIKMPKMSDTMEEGVIASWLKKVGDTVKSGDILAEVETDKATMELESYDDGTLLYIGVEEKASVPVDGVIAIIGDKGENVDDLVASIGSGESAANQEEKSESTEETKAEAPAAEAIDTSGINATVVKMPKMSDTMEEGVIAAWIKNVGDDVKSGDILAEVETDKATMELESYDDGVLLYTAVEAGKGVPVDGVIAIIGEKGADYETLLKAEEANSAAPAAEAAPAEKEAPKAAAPAKAAAPSAAPAPAPSNTNGRVIASPLAKKMAEEKGFDIAKIPGSGDGGRIIKRDVEAYEPAASPAIAGATSAAAVGVESYEDIPATQMRKAITKSLNASQFGAPHFYLTMEIDMDKTMEARASINEIAPVKISFNDIVIKAVAAALRKHPAVNSSWISETNSIRMNHHVSVGVAMAIEDGLVVPVVKFADNKSLAQISAEVKEFGGKAKAKKLGMDEMQGNTFTVSNLGMFGISEFTSIINAPESCILAVGAIKATPVVKNGEIVPGNIMKVTLTCDHRTVDGAVGSAFLQTLKGFIEDPVRILV
ncbi:MULTISPECIES: pyruvate dehydrogenase complex dihydrolipoamide acetyltransferase [Reichenbachiella]|uniref:pyruvate dehydrogenase complex dihydrolipoamide acetyltransferase n=1 Tax=Reichenbachiella TaxID=156993 RepID=UPI000E6CF7E4|nr:MULTISPECIES: pyruvate dehydrogenase complex dihydrolipoamide acetyltransferase [Reichenbachiella]MBU2915756.1 2-oxo acid dehydrogenase subunit E2 [Reichenbachiella agariperforans]RJE71979.1 pyruvate dehydrogenase [Reichenbachiella sp. MSK19-1]